MNETRDIEAASGLTVDEIQARLLVTVTGEDAAFVRRVVEENKALRELLRPTLTYLDLADGDPRIAGAYAEMRAARQSLNSMTITLMHGE